MALAATTIFEVRITGDDTNNGGAFDPGQTAGMLTDGAATVATGNSPVFTSASYNFVAGDVGAWIYIASGTNWTKGWYLIASVAANAATLSATIGTAILSVSNVPTALNTVAGCATTSSPTAATWSIDYSQQNTAQFTYTDLASVGSGLLVSSVAFPFGKQQVGNSLVITGGTNFNTGRYVIASVSVGLVATVVGPTNITSAAGVSGTGGQGGGLRSPGLATSIMVSGQNIVLIKYSASVYSITSSSTGASGRLSSAAGSGGRSVVWGYDTNRFVGNNDTNRPTLQVSGAISGFTVFNVGSFSYTGNLIIDCSSKSSMTGIVNPNNATSAYTINCKIVNATSQGINGGFNILCEASACATAFINGECRYCWAHDNTGAGFSQNSCVFCISSNNSGASSDGFTSNSAAVVRYQNCTAYNNGRDGFRLNTTNNDAFYDNLLSYGNAGFGINYTSNDVMTGLAACGSNTSGNINSATSQAPMYPIHQSIPQVIVLTADPFTNKSGNDYSLNTTAGGGAACRAAGFPGVFPGGTTTGYLDIGAVQHADPAGGGGGGPFPVYKALLYETAYEDLPY